MVSSCFYIPDVNRFVKLLVGILIRKRRHGLQRLNALFCFLNVNLVIGEDLSGDRIEIVVVWIEIVIIVFFKGRAFITEYRTFFRNARTNKGCSCKVCK